MCKYACKRYSNRPTGKFLKSILQCALLIQVVVLSFAAPICAQQDFGQGPGNNEARLNHGFQKLADTLFTSISPHIPQHKIYLQVEATVHEDHLTNILAQRIRQDGEYEVFLNPSATEELVTLETKLDGVVLSYVGIGRGLLRYPAVERRLQFDGFGRAIDADGRLLTTFAVANLVFSDTLSYAEAEAAAGETAFLAPPLPPSPYRRLVEPGLVLTITGALVYVFFASR